MIRYSFTIKRGESVLYVAQDVLIADSTRIWSFIDDIASQFEEPGLRVVVTDDEGRVVIMAGIINPRKGDKRTAA
jgi:hypothetical protein